MQIQRLRVSNEDFLVSSIIERCPKSMMMRELVKNAFEAAVLAPEGRRRVEIAPVIVEGVRKLSIWNTGPGMDAAELRAMCDIASSIGKANALDQNFGMGAKVASLPSNTHGIRYRSCKNGRVNQVVMGKRDGLYGRLLQDGSDGQRLEVIDVTQAARADGQVTDSDWTEVVLFGKRIDHDTVVAPYDNDPKMPPAWIAEELYRRFAALPADVEFTLRDGCNTRGGDQRFAPMLSRLGAYAKYEAVAAERGVRIHYLYDAPNPATPGGLRSAVNALQPARSSAALLYRDEIYDFLPPAAWTQLAPVFGIPFGAKYISIFVELPADFPLMPDAYRQFLRHNHNLQHNIQVREFSQMALRHRPAWLLDLLQSFAPDAKHIDSVHGVMAAMFRSLGVRRRWWPPGGDGKPRPPGNGEIEYEVAPQIVPLRDEADIRERGMEKKAARFYPETHQVFVNTGYSAFVDFAGLLEAEYAAHEDQERVRRTALKISERVLTYRVCRKLVYGLAKRGDWHGGEVDQATSMFSLTLAADDHTDHLAEAREEMRQQLGESDSIDPRLVKAREKLVIAMEDLLAVSPRRGPSTVRTLASQIG